MFFVRSSVRQLINCAKRASEEQRESASREPAPHSESNCTQPRPDNQSLFLWQIELEIWAPLCCWIRTIRICACVLSSCVSLSICITSFPTIVEDAFHLALSGQRPLVCANLCNAQASHADACAAVAQINA